MKAQAHILSDAPVSADAPLPRLAEDASVRELMRPFAGLLDDPTVTELVINRPQRVLIETHLGWHVHDCADLDFERLMSFAVAIATLTNQEVSALHPVLSALLPGDARIQIVIPPVVPPRTVSVTIRRPSSREKTLDAYAGEALFAHTRWRRPAGLDEAMPALRPLDRELARCLEARDLPAFFERAVRGRLNLAIVGNTGSGKTSFMKTLCRYIPATERIVTIEDVRELFIRHIENCVHLIYSKGGHAQARVTPADLIASTMRMRPDRVLLAELRGSEAYDFLKLLTTGHAGSITSYHASSAPVAIERFALMAKEHPEASTWDDAALRRLLFMTIDVVAHMEATAVFDESGEQTGRRWSMTEVWFDPLRRHQADFR
ncbi:P-type DNA transfer ATPase VirB11 [Burkholderia gladioli pv. gladioli]|uniref:Type IV secretion system protein n=1 Tax=Burkholderia gladioli TaxID=28095 RepID=A0A095F133_BURGA|nr:P-type DNA transfer ATPase VirB11 [Burkholderia gladioli]AJX00755.1 P-type DNA transfer ATPase VirB11 [Burkholderia gladioli]ASD80027.1 P-type DNA transfer ATPase VirB11 [Burkholderia gladioli pv. gladioli]AWY54726.1 P-type DNA transfer ATPase VirB11 [Burkholderia gladioli pv. gladioli]KGC11381.1 P-type DNA transfer ATPase VirB11 [Burkholderia gladioli]MDJ1160308.1 P-type DNA transfer ATPase VirB11 [Burkholderia gladioli pv. gladioli]